MPQGGETSAAGAAPRLGRGLPSMLVVLGCVVSSIGLGGALDVATSGASPAPHASGSPPCVESESAVVGGRTMCFIAMDDAMRDMLIGTPAHDHSTMGTAQSSGVTEAAASATGPTCLGDGSSGRRVQVLYMAAGASAASITPALRTQLETMLNGVDDIFNAAAGETGGTRFVRWVTEPAGGSCRATITAVNVSSTNMGTFGRMTTALQAAGFNRADRKYMIFAANNSFCGIGSVINDSSPGAANASNGGAAEYARVDNGTGGIIAGSNCWTAATAAHEIGHNLGAVQLDAPHTTSGWHCTDESDIMCYSDAPGVVMVPTCAGVEVFDCNHDDYFSTDPVPGSYLATHWNTANSGFLTDGTEEMPAPAAPTNVSVTTRSGQATVTWSAPPGLVYNYVATAAPGRTCSALGPALSCTITGLVDGTQYSIRVVASNTSPSPPSVAVEATPPGSYRPQQVAAVRSGSSIVVSWAPPADDGGEPISTYRATVLNGSSCTSAADVYTCTVDGVDPATEDTVVVVGLMADGRPTAASPAVQVPPVPVITAPASTAPAPTDPVSTDPATTGPDTIVPATTDPVSPVSPVTTLPNITTLTAPAISGSAQAYAPAARGG